MPSGCRAAMACPSPASSPAPPSKTSTAEGTSRSAKPCGDTVQPSNIIPVPIRFQLDLHRYPLQEALQLFTGVVKPSETIQLRIASGSWKSPFETIATSDSIVRLPRTSDHVMMLTLSAVDFCILSHPKPRTTVEG